MCCIIAVVFLLFFFFSTRDCFIEKEWRHIAEFCEGALAV